MKNEKKMNILVVGASGVGKTTLINSIAGIGLEEGITKKIDVYESSDWPLRFIDTKGFEYNAFEQMKTIWQIKRYSKKHLNNKKNEKDEFGIDAVWYCIEGTSRRTFDYNIKLLKRAIAGWKNVPVFVVITKSYSEVDIPKNIEEIKGAFENNPKINLKNIIPVVAQDYVVDKETTIAPKGIEELCVETIECFDEAKQISKENKNRLILNQKRFTAHASVIGASGIAAGIAFIDRGNKADSALLTPLEVQLTKIILKIYGVKYTSNLIKDIVGGGAITAVAKYIVGKFDRTQVIDAAVAGCIVFVLGEAVIGASEASYKGLIDLDGMQEYVSNKIENAPIVGKMVTYLKENKDKLSTMNATELVSEIKDFFKNNKNKSIA